MDVLDPFEERPPAEPPRRRSRGRRLVVAALLAAALVVGGGALYSAWALGGTGSGSRVSIEVEEGDTTSDIAARLERQRVIRSAFMFRLAARFRGVAAELKPGVYGMRRGLGVSGAIDMLRRGIPLKVERFTIPEGLTVIEIARRIGRETHVSEQEFLAALRRAPLPAIAREAADQPFPQRFEGVLFPETYEIKDDASAADVVTRLLSEFERRVATLDLSRARALGITAYEALILASLIEKEARLDRERPTVSSVIHNRLDRNMRLGIDATIQYVYIQRTGRVKNPLTFDDYELRSNYNTYRIEGLPPTPIAAPGIASLRAALAPERTEFLYYRLCNPNKLARGHVFGRTLAERDRKWRDCRDD